MTIPGKKRVMRPALAEDGPKSGDRLARWDAIAARLPELLDDLLSAPGLKLGEGAHFPATAGVYLFTEGIQPVYVGQTRNLRRRILQHTQAWARENQATFAFLRARSEALLDPTFDSRRTRKALVEDPVFAAMFERARRQVASMTIRHVEVDDPDLRTVFEVYATVLLGTENTFETH